jgi:hypothetical protein
MPRRRHPRHHDYGRFTAAAIAKMPDIGDGKTAMTGAEMQEMDTATGVDVFARASPEHKLRLGQVATTPCCQGDPPDVISAGLSRGAWALPRRSAGCSDLLLPLRHRPSPKEPQVGVP